MNWNLAAVTMALAALVVTDLAWGFVAAAATTVVLTVLPHRAIGRAMLPLAFVTFTLAIVTWLRVHPL